LEIEPARVNRWLKDQGAGFQRSATSAQPKKATKAKKSAAPKKKAPAAPKADQQQAA
jgi:hypothetical protein